MQVIFVGGANGVGASCVAIELANQWIVVDAGVRVDRKSDPLPDLALLEGKDVRAIFVTHAHADHIGALPLLHQAFPTTPIFASRGTALLMEVMLADALRIMTRRAAEEMEIPLYPETLVSGMLTQVRPIPVGEIFTLPQLSNITISTGRAGHIAGAISLGFTARDGAVVVSGDISSTLQRTVQGAVPPAMDRCDLLILESTYGARLHPNRQAEELRLAQAVANNLASGGHSLIPCFGLGRGQEILLLLQSAQEKGQVPSFPLYVDGLVRRVCSTYQLIPEALSPTLQRQIRKGYLPFTGANVTFVRDERERMRILAGPPACILSSSGMLTGGPSVWYAARLAGQEAASILITGYQDEESPGRKLLDLAEQKSDTLELGGQQVAVRCHVAKYSLSAHADGGELAAYAAALKPRQVALVHGDEEARKALRSLLVGTEVLLPDNGASLEHVSTRAARAKAVQAKVESLPVLPTGIGNNERFSYEHIPLLWDVVRQIPTLRIVTARELATVWYGEATGETTQDILDVLSEDADQQYFVRQHALEEAYRVRGQEEETPADIFSELVGQVLFLAVRSDIAKIVFCKAIEPGATIRVQFARGAAFERTRYPFSAILDVLGPAPQELLDEPQSAPQILAELSRVARRTRRRISARELALQCQEGATYTLGELCALAGLSSHSLTDRLAVAKLVFLRPDLFLQQATLMEGDGLARYCLAPDWQYAMEEPEPPEPPDQEWILSVIDEHLRDATDLYKRGIDPETGAVTLYFYFPAVARERYAAEIAAASEEAGVPVTLSPNAHQGALAEQAEECIPAGITPRGGPSIYHDRSVIAYDCTGEASPEAIEAAQAAFREATGWQLELRLASKPSPQVTPATVAAPKGRAVNPHDALVIAHTLLDDLPDVAKIGTQDAARTLLIRFYFPDVAKPRYAERLAALAEKTGWHIRIHPSVHQQALVDTALRLLPQGLMSLGTPSLHQGAHTVNVVVAGEACQEDIQEAQRQFAETAGWQLTLEFKGESSIFYKV
jgi:Cft2 family RNA processing exonuclease